MTKRLFLGLILATLAGQAQAQAPAPIPEAALDADFKNCAGDGKDPQRNAYCLCIRQGMSQWSSDTYAQAIGQARAANGNPASLTPGALTDLAKQCIAQVLH